LIGKNSSTTDNYRPGGNSRNGRGGGFGGNNKRIGGFNNTSGPNCPPSSGG
jgi:hypothetical protein